MVSKGDAPDPQHHIPPYTILAGFILHIHGSGHNVMIYVGMAEGDQQWGEVFFETLVDSKPARLHGRSKEKMLIKC